MKNLKSALLLVITSVLLSFDLPTGWFKAGNKPDSYEMGLETGSGQDGTNAATIKSIDKKIFGFGTLMQYSKADKYLGKRVKMTGLVKSENVKNWAGLWFRVDQAGTQEPLAFDNMGNRPIKGSTFWTKYEIVLNIPANASLIAYGALLAGTGQIWFDKIAFEIVGDVLLKMDSCEIKSAPPEEPANLDFEN